MLANRRHLASAAVFCVLLPLSGLAEDLSWDSDFTAINPSLSSPAWLQQLPPEEKSFAETRFEVTPQETSDLLVTITFNENPGGFLKVFWTTATGSEMLSENLYEGVGMPNQRRLLISQLTLREKGILTFQSSQEQLQIYRIHWEWLEPKVVAVADASFTLAAVDARGNALPADQVDGNLPPSPSDQWKGLLITAPLTDKPERIEQGMEFQFDLDKVPQSARLTGWIEGLPLDKNLTIWVNGRPQLVTVEVPDLSDPGYQNSPGFLPVYIGWRKIQLWIPTEWLGAETNKLQCSWTETNPANPIPVAVKDLSLQLDFSGPAKSAIATVPESSPLP